MADVLFRVVLPEGEDRYEHFDTKINQIACFSAKLEPKTGKLSAQICLKCFVTLFFYRTIHNIVILFRISLMNSED